MVNDCFCYNKDESRLKHQHLQTGHVLQVVEDELSKETIHQSLLILY